MKLLAKYGYDNDDARKATKRAIAAEKALSDVSENIEFSSDEFYQA